MKIGKDRLALAAAVVLVLAGASGCGPGRKIASMKEKQMTASIRLPRESVQDEEGFVRDFVAMRRDTVTVVDDATGKELILMKAVKDDESGEMVANDVINAAVVTARFRNVAERHGKIDLEFQVIVPQDMADSKWQLRFHPDMFILEDSIRLDDVVITGADYRKAQLRGYQQYEKFLSKIVSDTTRFIDIKNLEIFLERNLPQIYAFKTDSSEVADMVFESYFGVSEQQAIDHYTNQFLSRLNQRRVRNRGRMYAKYVKAPIVTEGIRLDTVVRALNGDFVYNYIQTINTRPQLRKVDIVLSGEIYEQEKRIYNVPPSDPLTFYISSVSAFVDDSERYIKQVVYRNADASASCIIDFKAGKADIDEDLGNNRTEMAYIKDNILNLMTNETFELDSISLRASASPEGSVTLNNALSGRRAQSASSYFQSYVKHVRDSLRREEGLSFTIGDESVTRAAPKVMRDIPLRASSGGENWDLLTVLMEKDTTLYDDEFEEYMKYLEIRNPDEREHRMRSAQWYGHMKDDIYPRLRTVTFDFHLHRKGMIKDTVNTTVLDSTYMRGVQLLKDHSYDEAIELLLPYNDYNTAICFVALDRNVSAMNILKGCQKTAQVNYMLALLYARMGDDQNAVQHYLRSCNQEPSYVYRGNLDPEISYLINKFGLNRQEEDTDL